jgi:hypothetical protein
MAPLSLMDRLRQDMQLRGLAARTQESYLASVESVARFCDRPPNALVALGPPAPCQPIAGARPGGDHPPLRRARSEKTP